MVREPLYTRITSWVNTILNHIDAKVILPKYDNSCMVYTLEWYPGQNSIINLYLTDIKICEILVVDTQMALKKTLPIPTLVDTFGLLLLSTFDKSVDEWRRRHVAEIVWDSLAESGPPSLMLPASSVRWPA